MATPIGQANQASAQEWQFSTGTHNHFASGPQELCNVSRDSTCTSRRRDRTMPAMRTFLARPFALIEHLFPLRPP